MKWSAILHFNRSKYMYDENKRIHCKNVFYVTKSTSGKEQTK